MKRGLRGVRLVTSDAHEGLKQAIAAVLSGATWQRCRVHFMRKLLATVPKGAREAIAAVVRNSAPISSLTAITASSRRKTLARAESRRSVRAAVIEGYPPE